MAHTQAGSKSLYSHIKSYTGIVIGSFLAAAAIQIFLFPNNLIDGGVVGISMILGKIYGEKYFSAFFFLLTLPFIYLSYRYIRKTFVIHMGIAVVIFAIFLALLEKARPFLADPLEIIVIGGAILGIGAGLIIRSGACLDGTEILAIIINRKMGFTVGQVVLFINFFVFGAYGWLFVDWHIALRSLMTYVIAFKMMDLVIVGLDEIKSVLIFSAKSKQLTECITQELGLGLTVMYGRGGYSGDDREILFVVVERLDLADLKEIVLREDPQAFMAIENLHEVVYGRSPKPLKKKRSKRFLMND
jgi:uncharacterized membrane-anchored protein YitT (DUF2179 family)